MPAKPGPDNYDVQLYLDRPKIFQQIIAWIAQRETRRRVLCLVAPPGSGKTWLLHHLQAELSKNPNSHFGEPLLTFWLDAPDVVNVASKDRSDVIHKDKALQWIKQCYQKTHSFCRHVPQFDPYLSYPRSIEVLVKALCNQCDLPDGPVLFVDGYDEIPKLCQEVLSDRLLAPFIEQSCVRIILAQRDQSGLFHYLLRRQQALLQFIEIESPIDAYAQFRILHGDAVSDEEFNTWKGYLKYYQWDNPFANRFLYHCAIQENPGRLSRLSLGDLQNCIEAVIQRPYLPADDPENARSHYPVLTIDHFQRLHELSQLSPSFTNEDLEHKLHTSVFNDELLKQFYAWGILLSLSGTSRYKLIDFIYALLQDQEELRQKGGQHE